MEVITGDERVRLTQTVALALAVSTAPGCSGRADKSASPPSAAQSVPTLSPEAKRSCPVTVPNGQDPAKNAGFNHGNGSLWIALWPHGKLVAGTRPDGSSLAEIRPDGSIDAKLGWWRGVEGQLTIRGRRLDAPPRRFGRTSRRDMACQAFRPPGSSSRRRDAGE